jgi:low temperature requirement protein LtrA
MIVRGWSSPRAHHVFTHHALYGHFLLIASIATVSVGFENMVIAPGQPLTSTHLSLLYGGTAVYLLGIAYLRWAASSVARSSRVALAGVILLLLVPALYPSAQA